MNKIQKKYEELCLTPSDINEHLPIIRNLCEGMEHVTEMGVRSAVATYAFLSANPKKYVGIDLHYHPNIGEVLQLAEDAGIDFEFRAEDTNKIEIEPTDVLLIDTLHRYSCCKKELELHAKNVRKYIIFHDVVTYGQNPEIGNWLTEEELANAQPDDRGILPAIQEFLAENPVWAVYAYRENNNGLMVITRQ